MRTCHSIISKSGHTLVELIAATACSAILLAGLGSVMLIARQIAYTPTASTASIQASAAINQMSEELGFATWVVEHFDNAIEFVVADRDGDNIAERIRYEWSGAPGDPLERSYNDAAPVAVAESVEDFQLSYLVDEETVRLTPYSDGAETKLLSYETVTGSSERTISSAVWESQQINPGGFSSVPAGATAWNATRIDFYGRKDSSDTETLLIQLRSSGNPYYSPTSESLGTITVPESGLGSSGWYARSFSGPIRGLSLSGRYNLVWATADASGACRLNYADTTANGVSESTDSGANWKYQSSRQLFYRLYGTYTAPGTPVDVTRSYLPTVAVKLQTTESSHSRIDAGITLANQPELVSAVWRADFDSDPTAVDLAGDGNLDWEMSTGDDFDDATLDDGTWTVDGQLESRPINDFTNVTSIEARCTAGATLRINADRQGGTHGPLIVRVTSSSGAQTLSLCGETAANVETTLATVERLASGWVRFRLVIVPQQNIVQLQIDDREIGTYVYPTYATSTTERFISLSGTGAQFDSVEARVSSDTVVQLVN